MAQHFDVQYVNFYCTGSSALKMDPVKPMEILELPRKKTVKAKKTVLRVDPLACAGILMAAVMMVMMVVGFAQLRNVQTEAAEMSAYVDTLRQENEALQTQFESGYDLEEVESVALALGMVPVEQVRHVSVPVDAPVAEEEPSAWTNFWASIVDFFA